MNNKQIKIDLIYYIYLQDNNIKSELKFMYRVNNCTRSMHRYSLRHVFFLVSLKADTVLKTAAIIGGVVVGGALAYEVAKPKQTD